VLISVGNRKDREEEEEEEKVRGNGM